MSIVMFLIGPSASGKSTFTDLHKNANTVVVSRDDIRREMMSKDGWDGKSNMWKSWKFTNSNESLVTGWHRTHTANAISTGMDVIIDDTNLNPTRVQETIDFCRGIDPNVKFKFVFFTEPVEELIKRDKDRLHSVGEEVIRKQFDQYGNNYSKLIYIYNRHRGL